MFHPLSSIVIPLPSQVNTSKQNNNYNKLSKPQYLNKRLGPNSPPDTLNSFAESSTPSQNRFSNVRTILIHAER